MVELDLKVFPSGPLAANNYLIFNRQSKKAFIVDLSSSSGPLFNFLKEENIKVDFVLLTHAHFDHIGGLRGSEFPYYLHQQDRDLVSDPEKNGSFYHLADSIKIDREPNIYKKELYFYKSKITVIHTPGHTPGSVSLKLNNWLFSGDTLFHQTIGRTDIPLASGELILKSIKEKILVLPDDTVVYPGHGPSTTLLREKETNPFLAG
ncbi:MAG: MBL fold metallo-hydrolase [Candidatus Omnitrophica bacterium]|nr:MBL fold metallo-hydrolase [Candidatus Omnitrophota bacterium]MCF7877508.1 MBL fold metallo-hydrolase [Candidatus Omnitrophota bacterium]MCF7877869.1 MBL fold metallo-hydrolase [Candidatus Omnitrophota bacterium]MCF7892561.1 MBL fold metallo-hydrolase [Candidatus Omnitrophota bacterium]